MGRTKYSADEREKMITAFIRTTREIIDMEGVEQTSIRKVASRTGYNSATIYLYFQDLDELITLASMSYLENYCRTLAADIPQMQTAEQIYHHTWNVFCQYAFTYPQVFYRLFFFAHSRPLTETVERYYQIYPHQLDNISGILYEMLHVGTLEERNLLVLRPLAVERGMDEGRLNLINDLTVCYFRKLLEERCQHEGALVSERLMERLTESIRFLIDQ